MSDLFAAILQLKKPIKNIGAKSKTKRRICLPDFKFSTQPNCYIAGYSRKKNSLPKFSYEELLIIPKDICNLEENYNGKIDDYQLCASAINKNVRVCSGDNGASFFCKNTGKIFFVNCSLWKNIDLTEIIHTEINHSFIHFTLNFLKFFH